MVDFLDRAIDGLLNSLQLNGYSILLVTLPLAIIQAFIGVYPFAALVMLHISALGMVSGLLVSWAVGIAATVVVYLVFAYFFSDWFHNRWLNRLSKYQKIQKHLDHYGVWTLIILRTIPVMPNNLVSFMASLSKIRFSGYVWSSVWGMLSHIWLLGILSSAVMMPDMNVGLIIWTYVGFWLIFAAFFATKQYIFMKRNRGRTTDALENEETPTAAL